jgi:hypothetical protein
VTTGAKIAIGCGVALVLCVMAVAVAVFSGAYWLKGKAEEVTGNESRIEELHARANATPFDRPEDGVIREDRLVKFIDVRKRVFAVYEKHRATLEAMGQKKQGDWGDVTTGFSVINEIRVAQAQAIADVGMSEDEYRFMVEQVYKTAWAAEAAKAGVKPPSAAPDETGENAADMDVPEANIALFRKYEAELKQYAMAGLEWIGL